MNQVTKIANFYQVTTINGDVISKRYRTENGAVKQLNKINNMEGC